MKRMFALVMVMVVMMFSGCTSDAKARQNVETEVAMAEVECLETVQLEAIQVAAAEEKETTEILDLERFFFVPFETGGTRLSTYAHGSFGDSEVYIGVFATTTMDDFSGSQELCKNLSEADSNFVGELAEFASWSNTEVIRDMNAEESQIVSAFEKLDQTDHERFLNLQLSVMEMQYEEILYQQGVEWLLDGSHSPALIGSYYSLLNWAPSAGWENSISPEKTDKENLISLYFEAFENMNIMPYYDGLRKRFEKQMVFAMDMLYGEKNYYDIVTWMIDPQW